MGCNRYAINCTYLNCTILYHLRYTYEIITVTKCCAISITMKVLHLWVYAQGYVTMIRVYFRIFSFIPKETPSPWAVTLLPRQLPQSTAIMDLPAFACILYILYKWNKTVCGPLRLAALTLHDVFKVHPYSKYQYTLVNHLRNHQNIFKSGCIILYSQELHTRVLISLQPPVHLLSGFFFFFFNYYSLPSECELIFHILWFWSAFLW